MATIRVVRNDAGNCVNFYGTSNPTYWNACLSASIDETYPDRINVRNDIRSQEEDTDIYEFYQIPYTQFVDKDGNAFESPADAAQYITDNAHVVGDTGTYIFSETETLDAQREATNTTVLFSNGDSYAVNALRAVDADNGTITIRTVRADKEIYKNIRYYNVTVNDGAVSFNTVNAAVDRLNEVLTGSTVGTDAGNLSGGAATESALATFEVYGSRLVESGSGSTAGYTSTAEAGNFDTSNGILSVESISEAGEYFEFSQDSGDWTNTVGLTFGLFDETTYDRSDLEVDEAGNAVKAVIRLRVKNSGFIFKDPASTYGRLSESGLQNQLDTRTTFRVGLDASRRGYIAMQLEDGTFQNVGRTELGIAANTELKFVAIFPLANQLNGVRNMTVNTLTDSPTLTWHYIESPDGSFYYPLFATELEANYADELYGTAADGAGASHTHIFPDEQPTVNTWYMPASYMFHAQSAAPTLSGVTYNEITTGDDAAHAPSLLNIADYNWDENYSVNLQIVPAGADPATVTGLPSGLTYTNGFITGTTPYVPYDTDYTVTVVRSNAYGSTTETFTITIQDNASLGDIAGFTEFGGNLLQPNRVILTHDAVLQYDTQISPGEELTYSYGSGANPPTIGILSTDGQTDLTAFDAATDVLGVGDYDFAQTAQWSLRYTSFGGDIGAGDVNANLVGWADNAVINGSEGTNHGIEFKLEYGLDGYIKLYRGGVLLLTSASTFTGAQTLTFAGFDSQAQTDLYIPTNLTVTNSAAGTTTPPSGFTDPLETGVMETQTLMGNGTDTAVVTLTQTLAINHRYVVPQEWIETNVLPYIAGAGANSSQDEQFYFGVPKTGVNWATMDVNHFHAVHRIEGYNSSQGSKVFYDNTTTNTTLIASATDAYYEYGIEWDGTTLHMIRCNTNDLNTTPAIADGGTFVSVQSMTVGAYAGQPLPLVMGVRNGGQINLTTSGLNHIRTPFGAQTVLVGEASGGGSMFALAPSATVYDSHSSGHASTSIGMSFDAPTLNAGSTYKFIYHPSLEAGDDIKFTRIDDGTDYTTGVTFFDNTSNGDPSFTEPYKGVTFAVPSDAPPLNVGYNNDYQGNTNYVLKPLAISGSTYVTPVTGVTQEGPVANQTGSNIFDAGDYGWLSIDEQLGGGERLVLSSAFLADLADAMPVGSEVKIGLKDTGWTATTADINFEGALRFVIEKGATGVTFRTWQGNTSTSLISTTVAGITSDSVAAFFDLTSSGNNIRFGIRSNTTNSTNTESSTPYADWDANYKVQTGDQGYGLTSVDVMILGRDTTANAAMDSADVDWTALSEISVPSAGSGYTTGWTKALDFSGSSERAQQVSADSNRIPIKMNGTSSLVSAPATTGNTVASGYPWASAMVFQVDGNSSNQHIWNLGEGAGSTDDNIYVRLDSSRRLYFGWGRSGALNECYITQIASSPIWYGLYIGFNGTRYNATDATAGNLASVFDIRLMSSYDSFGNLLDLGGYNNWNHSQSSTGGRMDRQFAGDMTVGGRGTNRNFHGKVASVVMTTLRSNVAMPTDTEIKMMIRDPEQWVTDYKVGNAYRLPWQTGDAGFNFSKNDGSSSYATQVWLMGDGENDAYAQIRNDVWAATQSYTPLNMVSMVANDIETVTIPGLS